MLRVVNSMVQASYRHTIITKDNTTHNTPKHQGGGPNDEEDVDHTLSPLMPTHRLRELLDSTLPVSTANIHPLQSSQPTRRSNRQSRPTRPFVGLIDQHHYVTQPVPEHYSSFLAHYPFVYVGFIASSLRNISKLTSRRRAISYFNTVHSRHPVQWQCITAASYSVSPT